MKTIFISSTFKDMQVERDILHQHVFPQIRERLAAYGENVQELDLRWGVYTTIMSEEESGSTVIESCIDSIDRCKPYMIVLLGNRYGWIPEESVLENIGDERISSRLNEKSSITQLEIAYGALSEKANLEKCIFWTLKGAEVYRRLGDIRRNTFWYMEALRWFFHMMKQSKQEKTIWQTQESTAQPSQDDTTRLMMEDTNTAWEICQILLKQVHAGDVTDHRRLMEIIDAIADVSAAVCRLTGEESRMSEATAEDFLVYM